MKYTCLTGKNPANLWIKKGGRRRIHRLWSGHTLDSHSSFLSLDENTYCWKVILKQQRSSCKSPRDIPKQSWVAIIKLSTTNQSLVSKGTHTWYAHPNCRKTTSMMPWATSFSFKTYVGFCNFEKVFPPMMTSVRINWVMWTKVFQILIWNLKMKSPGSHCNSRIPFLWSFKNKWNLILVL